ncbi:MAG: efflux RND transporter periplasmic adaptor subunit [Planctomycetota bacterium]|jgi:membrane fusion protein (multidrug efflux system)
MQRSRRALLTISLAGLVACGKAPETTAPPAPISVTAVPVVSASVQEHVEVLGRVRPIQAAEVTARVSGQLTEVSFEFGTAIEAGAPLFQVDREPFQIAVDAATAKVTSAEALWMQAQQYRERLEGVRAGGVPENELQTAVLEEQRLLAQVEAAQADLRRAELELDWTSIVAPITGTVGRTDLALGDLVGPSTGILVRINQIDPIEAEFFVPETIFVENELDRRAAGISVEDRTTALDFDLRLAGGSRYGSSGTLSYVDNEVDTATGTVALRAVFDNPDRILMPNQYVSVLIDVGVPAELPVVPRIAILQDRSGKTVLVGKSDGSYERREVTLGADVGRNVAVVDGLAVGELVITEGLDRIRPGAELDIEVVDATAVVDEPDSEER